MFTLSNCASVAQRERRFVRANFIGIYLLFHCQPFPTELSEKQNIGFFLRICLYIFVFGFRFYLY